MNNMKVHLMHAEVSAALERLSTLFKPGMKISFIARLPGNGEADVLIGDDHDADELIALVRRRFGASTVSASSALAAADDVRNQALEDAKEASEILESFIDNVSTDGPYGAEATLTFIGQAKQCVDGAIHALITTAAQAATDKSED